MSDSRKHAPDGLAASPIEALLNGIRVPDLPYPPGALAAGAVSDWRPLLLSCWSEQRDERVTHVIRSVNLDWSIRQVNAAYLADRIMDVFLSTSGLHPELSRRIARLRFFLAWRLDAAGGEALSPAIVQWLDGLGEWRGWSNTRGRSNRALLDQLDGLVSVVSGAFDGNTVAPVLQFCEDWQQDAAKRAAQIDRLSQRLLDTEQGAARQRQADQVARALLGRALQDRHLPETVVRFLRDDWYRLLKQAVWSDVQAGGPSDGNDGLKHGRKLLEWLVWACDPALSDGQRNRLYQVGEQLGERVSEVWQRLMPQPLTEGALADIERALVARLRGEALPVVDALATPTPLVWEPEWLSATPPAPDIIDAVTGKWFVWGEGASEERRRLSAVLPGTAEILWTNGAGVKLGLQAWASFEDERTSGVARPLPELTPFGVVLARTVQELARVYARQKAQRERAAAEASARAEALRRQQAEEAERRRLEAEAREAALAREREAARQQQLADEAAEQARLLREQTLLVQEQVANIKLGGWIVVQQAPPLEPRRLKLAVRINASRKLVFVDRLGLNRQEWKEDELVAGVLEGRIRLLGSGAEFDDTLTRVVGRIRVGRQ